MNKSEQEICETIIKNIEHIKFMNKAWLNQIGGNKRSSDFIKLEECGLYKKEYTYLDYLDGRKNLIQIDNFCKYTGEKINKKRIKEYLFNYFKLGKTT